jgi:PhzF family phenazine biosynthesis protein
MPDNGAMPNHVSPTRGELDYYIVDVFTRTPFEGNPLAVVMNTGNLTTERMQVIAREFNLSETTFVERRAAEVEEREGVRVRIFTTQEELNFAGHPTLGTASVLRLNAPDTMRENTVTLAENVGAVPVRFSDDGAFGEMTQRDPEFGAELDAKEVARLTGLAVEDLDAALPPQIVSTGTGFAIVVLKSDKALAKFKVSQQEARSGCVGMERGGFMCWDRQGSQSLRGERACSSTAEKIQLRDQRPGAPSATWCSAAQWRLGCACTFARAWRWAGRATCTLLLRFNRRRCAMFGWAEALFLLQKAYSGRRDAHALHRDSSSQVTVIIKTS